MLIHYVKNVIILVLHAIHLLNVVHAIVFYNVTWIFLQENNFAYVLNDIIQLLELNNVCFAIQIALLVMGLIKIIASLVMHRNIDNYPLI
jgi:hypothetical protein